MAKAMLIFEDTEDGQITTRLVFEDERRVLAGLTTNAEKSAIFTLNKFQSFMVSQMGAAVETITIQ